MLIQQGFSQSIIRQSIGTIGSSYSDESITIQQSTGQVFNTSSSQINNMENLPGFIQPKSIEIDLITDRDHAQIELLIFPNPSSDKISFISDEIINNVQLILYDQLGEQIHNQKVINLNNFIFDCSHLAGGIYYLSLEKDGGSPSYYAKLTKN